MYNRRKALVSKDSKRRIHLALKFTQLILDWPGVFSSSERFYGFVASSVNLKGLSRFEEVSFKVFLKPEAAYNHSGQIWFLSQKALKFQ
jgi:hypothetical protein